jgi:hypothetical protein
MEEVAPLVKLLNSLLKISVAAIRVTTGEYRRGMTYELRGMSQILRSPWNPCKWSTKTPKN